MTKQEYIEAIQRAYQDFINGPLKDFPDPIPDSFDPGSLPTQLEEANDELMLAIYHHTPDRRSA